MKKYVFPIIYSLVIMLIGGLLTTLLYYFNITNDKINKIILYLIGITAMFIGSLKLSKNLNQKGIISGLVYFTICFVVIIFTSLVILKVDFKLTNIIYYLVLLIFSLLGGIIGKNMKEETSDN